VIDKKAPRGTYVVKHEQNSINYITVMDSKPVSIASTAAGVTPLLRSKRYSSERYSSHDLKLKYLFCKLFISTTNSWEMWIFMMDNNILPSIRSRK